LKKAGSDEKLKSDSCFFFILFIISLIYFIEYRNLYLKSLWLRLDPLEEKNVGRDFNQKVLAIGSSSIKRWPFDDITIIHNMVFNAGIEGQTSTQVLLRFERLLVKHKPQYCIIMVGLNDIKSIGLLKHNNEIEIDYITNIKRIIELCLDNQIVPIYITNFPTAKEGILRKLVWNSSLDEFIMRSNNEIKLFCSNHDVYVFDAYAVLVEENSLKRKSAYTKDFLHLNKDGYRLLNTKLELELQKIIK